MIKDFSYFNPVKIMFGNLLSEGIKEFYENHPGKLLLITGKKSQFENGNYAKVERVLNQYSISFEVWPNVTPNPTYNEIDKALKLENDYSGIIALGGGSVIDASKCMGAVIKNKKSIRELLTLGEFDNIPIIAIPTTAGTGSSVTQFTVIMDRESKDKRGYSHGTFFPEIAVADPAFTLSMPRSLTANTGLDALTHLIEAYLSRKANPITDALALEGIDIIKGNILKAYKNPDDKKARSNMLYAALLGGITISQAGTILLHAMGYPLTVYFDVPHGLANAILLENFLKITRENGIKKVENIFDILPPGELSQLLDELNIRREMSQYEVDESMLDIFTDNVMDKRNLPITPFNVTRNIVRDMYERNL